MVVAPHRMEEGRSVKIIPRTREEEEEIKEKVDGSYYEAPIGNENSRLDGESKD